MNDIHKVIQHYPKMTLLLIFPYINIKMNSKNIFESTKSLYCNILVMFIK